MSRNGIVFFALALAALLAGCKKNQQIDLRPNLNAANDLILSNRPFVYSFRLLERAVNDSLLQATRHSAIDGASVSLDTAGMQYTFSFKGAFCTDSVTRHGTLRATIDSGFYQKGSSVVITFLNYFEDSHRVTGLDSLRCDGLQDGNHIYRAYIDSATIVKDSGRTIRFWAEYRVTIVPGLMVQGFLQKAILFEGPARGISSAGYVFTAETEDPMVVYGTCPWIAYGRIAFTLEGAAVPTGTIEFMGKNGCSDRVDYDFEGAVNHTWMKEQYLRH